MHDLSFKIFITFLNKTGRSNVEHENPRFIFFFWTEGVRPTAEAGLPPRSPLARCISTHVRFVCEPRFRKPWFTVSWAHKVHVVGNSSNPCEQLSLPMSLLLLSRTVFGKVVITKCLTSSARHASRGTVRSATTNAQDVAPRLDKSNVAKKNSCCFVNLQCFDLV